MKLFVQRLFLLWILFASMSTLAEAKESISDLTQDACRYYLGENVYAQSEVGLSELPPNPLAASRLGRQIVSRNFSGSYLDKKYLVPDEALNELLSSDEFKYSVDKCYGTDETAKINFVILLKRLEVESKVTAGYLEILNWTAGGKILGGVIGALTTRFARTRIFFSWMFKAMGVYISYEMARQAVWYYKYLKGNRKKDDLKIDPAIVEKSKADESYSHDFAEEALRDWKEQIERLQTECDQKPEGFEKQKLQSFIQQQLKEYSQQLQELRS